ncbi:hypothetical protein KR054_002530 [Drosophila jambulina]|nr:hypothetical protein KR054_002530 [Drosophila jambulina]
MYFKFIVDHNIIPGHNCKFQILKEAQIFDLKRDVASVAHIPANCIQIKFLETTLDDSELLYRAAQKILALGMSPTSDTYHKSDLMTFYKDQLVGRLRVINEVGSRDCLRAVDMPLCDPLIFGGNRYPLPESIGRCMDAECDAESSTGECNACEPSDDDEPPNSKFCGEKCCTKSNGGPMHEQVMPENRQYAVIIASGECDCLQMDRLIHMVTEHLRVSAEAKTVSFSVCAPVVPMDDAVMIVGADAESRDWVLRVIEPVCPPYKCSTFMKHFDLARWCIVVPTPKKYSMCRIFINIQQQNCPLKTDKWVVMSQSILDTCSKDYAKKAVAQGLPHLELVIYIDCESAALIADSCYKVQYVLWRVPFKPCSSAC